MTNLQQSLFARLQESFRAYYDITPFPDGANDLYMRCDFHSRNSRYVLSKKAELWAAETHEYLYVYIVDTLCEDMLARILSQTLDDGTPRIKPHSQHMSTTLTALVLCQNIQPDAKKKLEKTKKRQEFKLSLHGWMELGIAAIDLSGGEISTNAAARSLKKDLKGIVAREIQYSNLGEETI